MKFAEYLNGKGKKEEADNRTVHSPFLWEQLGLLRGTAPSKEYRRRWKVLVGCSKIKGKGEAMTVVSDGRHYLTPREAAGIVMIALWDGEVRAKVSPELNAIDVLPSKVEALFDKWMASDPSEDATQILKWIKSSQELTYDILSTTVNQIAKKPIPPTTIRSWVARCGGTYRVGEVCPIEVAMGVYQILKQRLEPMKDAA
jgi:hypothetical protein